MMDVCLPVDVFPVVLVRARYAHWYVEDLPKLSVKDRSMERPPRIYREATRNYMALVLAE